MKETLADLGYILTGALALGYSLAAIIVAATIGV